jgi:hypothetical protein
VLSNHGKESAYENEIVCSPGGVAVLAVGFGGDGRVVLLEVCEVLPGTLLRRKLLRGRRKLLPRELLQIRQAVGNRQ